MTLTNTQFNQLKQALEQKKKQQGGYFQRVGTSLKETAVGLGQDLQTQAETYAGEELQEDPSRIKQGIALGRGGLRTAGAFAKGVLTPVMEAPGIKQATEFIGEKLAKTAPIQKFQEWSERHPEAAKDIMNTLDIAALFGGKAMAKPITTGAKQVAQKTSQVTQKGVQGGLQTGKQLIERGKTAIQPVPPTPLKAMGQVLQGKAKDIKSGFKALKEVDTTGVKTYSDLAEKTQTTIKNLSRQVDEVLDNKIPVKLNDLKLTGKTTAGKSMSIDYVSRGLEHLKELYKTTGDDIAQKNIDDILRKAKTVGLTRREVNNVAREYGIEFSEKAFSKMGDPLTSVNAVKFENTRKALKMVARKGLKGEQAQAIDESISSLYRVNDLVKKNVEAVNKLTQKIQERGLLERIGYGVAKTADVVSGGSLRGILGGLLPRGVGYKVMNALDLEQTLQKNLNIIKKAFESGDEEIIKLLKVDKTNLPK